MDATARRVGAAGTPGADRAGLARGVAGSPARLFDRRGASEYDPG